MNMEAYPRPVHPAHFGAPPLACWEQRRGNRRENRHTFFQPPGDTVKTALIDGKPRGAFDASLFFAIDDLIPSPTRTVWSESLLVGVQNERGELYRAIGVTGLSNFIHLIRTLHALGYTNEDVADEYAEIGFDVMVRAPGNRSRNTFL